MDIFDANLRASDLHPSVSMPSRPVGPRPVRMMQGMSEIGPETENNYKPELLFLGKNRFMSFAADMEYLTLSSILQDHLMPYNNSNALATSTEGTPNSTVLLPGLSPHNHLSSLSHERRNFPCDPRTNQYVLGANDTSKEVYLPDVMEFLEEVRAADPAAYVARITFLALSFSVGTSNNYPEEDSRRFKEPEEIYSKVTKPFSYTPGYHKLIAYLRGRFPGHMLVKMAESMAAYRPSFIACTNLLRETDLVFMEQCFQRTLLTYDTFIKVSGTPTIVWRRTGEIAYVGQEFALLTGWTEEQLLGLTPMFIVELLDDQSVVEYFQLFSRLAFGNFLGATMTECTLLTPKKGVKIRAGCIWTLKRDVFGIPMMVVGNFLPVV